MSATKLGVRAHRKKELHKLAVARSDIEAALDAAEMLQRTGGLSDGLYKPLFHATAVSYGRPFTNNTPYGSLSAKWGRFSEPRLQEIHDNLLRVRNELAAHSDQQRRRVEVVPAGTVLPKGRAGRLMLSVDNYLWRPDRIQDVVDACRDLGGRLNEEVEARLRELFGDRQLPPQAFPLTFDDE